MARGKAKTGDPTEYDAGDLEEIVGTLARAFARTPRLPARSQVTVTAEIEWAGTLNPRPHRTTTLPNVPLGPVRDAVLRAASARQEAVAARPYATYTATGWHAQLAVLTSSARGIAAGDAVGLSATRRTVLAWLAEDRAPSRANRAKIEQAYRYLADTPVRTAWQKYGQAARAVGDALNGALRDSQGAEIRLRDITQFHLG